QRRGTLGAVAAAASGWGWVPLELLDAQRGLVHVGGEAARGLAGEADRRDQRVAPLHLTRPGGGIVFLPVLPALDGRVAGERERARHGDAEPPELLDVHAREERDDEECRGARDLRTDEELGQQERALPEVAPLGLTEQERAVPGRGRRQRERRKRQDPHERR